jgi:twitching motility protein PilT
MIDELIRYARREGASDLHIAPCESIALRVEMEILRLIERRIEADEADGFLRRVLDRRAQARFDSIGLADAVYHDAESGAIRVHASRGSFGPRLAIRLIRDTVPTFETLNLPPKIASLSELRSGLVIVSGPCGAGKTTAIASLIERVNVTRCLHVLTLDMAIEHRFQCKRSIFSQYEVGRDVSTFADGVRGALRADADVLCIGEIRDSDTVAAMLYAAEAGQVVFASLQTPAGAVRTLTRLVALFPQEEQERVRMRLAETLRALVALKLVPRRDGASLWPACEVLVTTDADKRILREGAIHQLRGAIMSARKNGSQTLESHLSELVATGIVDLATARSASHYPDEIIVEARAHRPS